MRGMREMREMRKIIKFYLLPPASCLLPND
jgi:hypothetical protein